MNDTRRNQLERAGWAVSDAAEFLHLTEEESRFLELKLALASALRKLRERASRGLRRWKPETVLFPWI